MGLLSDAAALARGRTAAIFLTAALPLVPAYLVGGSIIYLAVARATAEPDLPRGEALAERRTVPPDAPAEERRDLLREAQEPGAPRRPTISLTLVAGLVFGGLAFLAGLFLAQAALLAIACGAAGPGAACASVGTRFHALGRTLAAVLALVALGCAAGGVPGLFAAFAFSLAGAVTVAETVSGFTALHRSWELLKQVWPAQLVLIVCATAVEVLLTQALGRLVPGHVVLPHALLDAAVAAIVLPLPVFASAVLYLRARSAAEGRPLEELLQYIRRTSAPG
jgi:hypothetical protein